MEIIYQRPWIVFFENSQLRVFEISGKLWIAALDICNCVGFSTLLLRKEMELLGEEDKTIRTRKKKMVEEKISLLSESGINSVVSKFQTPAANKFRRWMATNFKKLLEIEKHGNYENF